jgi:hypothetical protein
MKKAQHPDRLTMTKNLAKLGIRNARDHQGNVIRTFTLRETDGDDETIATQSAAQKKDALITPSEEIVKLALVEVNGVEVEQPYDAYDRWNSKARSFAMSAYRQLNGISPQEMESFLKDGEPTAVDHSPDGSLNEGEPETV